MRAVVLGVALFGPGCGELGERQRYAAELAGLEIVETIPAPRSRDADPWTTVDLCFSAELDPRALADLDATLRSGELLFDTQQELQLFSWRAPGSRGSLASERWCPGSVLSITPASALQPGITYRVSLRPAPLGWAGEQLDTDLPGWVLSSADELRWFSEFTIAGDAADAAPTEPPEFAPGPSLTALFEPGEIFDPARAACGCHQRADELALARLDLRDPETAWSALVLRTGLEPTGFPMISPRRPAESYLIHKLLRTASGEPLHALRGAPMPPDQALPHADLVRVAHWIADGAASSPW